ncbi:hypothetical protein XENOCAPTIV_028763 [Xenoophorus captivus]|uniref:Uncharacterized protein n=1 Tax=Xenoophorus captivus TaxID=1517983 RepID=A0ABV0S481_9TELE
MWRLDPFYSNSSFGDWGFKERNTVTEKLPLDLTFMCMCVCVFKWLESAVEKWELSVSLMRPTFSVHTLTQTHTESLGQWKCHIIVFPFQDKRHAHWIRSDH